MLLKKSAIVLSCPVHPASSSSATQFPSFTSSLLPSKCQHQHQQRRRQRCYATAQHSQSQSRSQQQQPQKQSDDRLPDWPRAAHPTPYEIFDINRSAPYTKKRFYQLVKLYHPDKHQHHTSPSSSSATTSALSSGSAKSSASHAQSDLSPSARLERYRLVVAANDLLSSPSKRHLYDTHGLGWHLHDSSSSTQHPTREDLRRADRAWRTAPNSAAHNATWEDWERWHAAQNGGAQNQDRRPLYMPNGLFASLVVALCLVGAAAQRSRAQSIGEEYVEWKAKRHAAIGEELGRRGQVMAGMGRDERVDAFLKERENANYQYSPGKYDPIPNR